MRRVVVTALVVAALPLTLHAAEESAIRLIVAPMPAPRPALKYQLLPELRELNPGNAAQNYMKCFMEQRLLFYTKATAEDRARYQKMPLSELPLEKVRNYGGAALRQADWAARLDSVDWQTLDRIQNGSVDAGADEVGPLQDLAAALHVRIRAEVAERHFDDAIRSAKTMFALARHTGEHSTVVADLVGLWTAHLSLNALEEMVQQRGCPNLYWALTDLPCPLVELRKGAQGDCTLVEARLRSLRADGPMTEAEIEAFVSHWSGVIGFARAQRGRSPRNLRAHLGAMVKDPALRAAAAQRLVEAGCPPDLVKSFPPTQVILLDAKREYEVQRDERLKLLGLPLWQIHALSGDEEPASGGDGIFADLLPHVIRLRQSQARLQQQVALLRQVEAIRLYAAAHDGKPPAKPSDVPVPLPDDPVTGKPFVYYVEGGAAHIRGESLPGEGQAPGLRVHYEVILGK